ncbi:MAG TPA: hypothetical protein VIC26_13270 [Marinagarivorans sp.]
MISQCPKCQYERQVWDNKTHPEVCPQCGIVYRKWLAKQAAEEAATSASSTSSSNRSSPHEQGAKTQQQAEYCQPKTKNRLLDFFSH